MNEQVGPEVAEPVRGGESSRPSIRVEAAVKSFDGRVVVDIGDLVLGRLPVEGLIGPNGAGKTTLLRMIMHSVKLDQGVISYSPSSGSPDETVVISDLPPHQIASLGIVKTNQVIQDFDNLTILDSLLLSVADSRDERAYRLFRENDLFEEHVEEIRWYLRYFDLEHPAGFALSAGEKKLLDVIRCLLLRPRVLLLDEPTAGLPDDMTDRVMTLVRQRASEDNMSVVIVEHDLNVIWSMCEYVHFMAEGEVVLQGDPPSIRQNETVVEKYLGSGHVRG